MPDIDARIVVALDKVCRILPFAAVARLPAAGRTYEIVGRVNPLNALWSKLQARRGLDKQKTGLPAGFAIRSPRALPTW